MVTIEEPIRQKRKREDQFNETLKYPKMAIGDLELPALDGSSVSIFDSVVLGLAAQIETIFDECGNDNEASIEVEGRIGVLKDGDRLRLPVDSEVLLAPPTTLRYSFESGVTHFQFEKLKQKLKEKLRMGEPNPIGRNAFPNEPTEINTHDDIYNLNESFFEGLNISRNDTSSSGDFIQETRSVRISYLQPKTAQSNPIEAIYKDRKLMLNFYTGRDLDEGIDTKEGRSLVDIRVAVNVEYKIKQRIPVSSRKVRIRQRHRISYPVSGRYRIDITTVQSSLIGPRGYPLSPTVSYEVEVEMNSKVLRIEIEKKRKGEAHHLFYLVREFLGVLRGFAAFFNSSGSPTVNNLALQGPLTVSGGTSEKSKRNLANLADCGQKPEFATQADSGESSIFLSDGVITWKPLSIIATSFIVDTYLHYVSPVVPIIGDYLFRAVAPQRKAVNEPQVTDSDIHEAMKIELTPEEKSELEKKLAG